MLDFKILRWGNAFSYGDNNEIVFDDNPLTQIVGLNGHGKSSIPSILEEVLFNKNSKGIKKADILNRYSDAKFYWIELTFIKEGKTYVIYTKRGSTQAVKLTCDGVDISAHTSTNTYKLIEEIIGYDHKTFSQIVYQPTASSLEFLTATDLTRKKFLIDILNLEKYTSIAEVFKNLVKEVSNIITGDKASISVTEGWLKKIANENLEEIELVKAPEQPEALRKSIASLEQKLSTIDSDNKQIVQNNKYKEILDSITIPVVPDIPESLDSYVTKRAEIQAELNSNRKIVDQHKHKANQTACPTCKQQIDNSASLTMLESAEVAISSLNKQLVIVAEQIANLTQLHSDRDKAIAQQTEWEKYHSLYRPELPTELLVAKDIAIEINNLRQQVKNIEQGIKTANEHNLKAYAHNSKVKVLAAQKVEMLEELAKLNTGLSTKEKLLNTRQLLVKTFSTTGLVSYKIECLVRDLEEITNDYLVQLSDGRFQLSFHVSSSDKLNVVITDNGTDIEITALSGGELARVNIATLLGIRKLMQAISNNRSNLLFLDETIDNLDVDGKDKLVEVLLNEEYLNTFIISHGYKHPLLEQLNVVKTDNISRIVR